MKKFIFPALACLFFQVSFAQKATNMSVVKVSPDGSVNHSVLDKAPLLKGCETATNASKCTDDKIKAFVKEQLAKDNAITASIKKEKEQKVYVRFIVTEQGSVQNIGVRTQNTLLKARIQKVLEKLPTFSPGKQNGRTVSAAYSLYLNLSETLVHKSSQIKL